jgi:hypothetical protein
MGIKAEISWKRHTPEGERQEIYARRVSGSWRFFNRPGRYENWQPLLHPPLEDWLTLLEAVERRVARRLHRPEEVDRLRKTIRENFPDAPARPHS